MSDTPIRDCELEVDGNLLCIETDAVAKCYGEGDYELDDFATANAERIAACWNAMRGVPSESLGEHFWEDVEEALKVGVPQEPAIRRLRRLCEQRRASVTPVDVGRET